MGVSKKSSIQKVLMGSRCDSKVVLNQSCAGEPWKQRYPASFPSHPRISNGKERVASLLLSLCPGSRGLS